MVELQGDRVYRIESWFRRHGWQRVARLIAAWDERGLGR